MSHLALLSGVPQTVSGVRVGATDFREFPLASGIPAGITQFAIGPNAPSPAACSIGNDVVEGNFFSMTGLGGEAWAFGLDGFFGEMDQGELLARVLPIFSPGLPMHSIGPAAGIAGLIGEPLPGADIEAWSGVQFLRDGVADIESQVRATFSGFGTTFFTQATANLQVAYTAGIYVWIRIRKTTNGGDPTRDDFEVRTYYGDPVLNNPILPDAIATLQVATGAGTQAIGWAIPQGLPAQTNEHRITFLSFSANPLVEPPPLPSDIVDPVPPGPLWVERVQPLGLESGVPATINGVKCGATDFREFSVATGVPSGITKFGLGIDAPTLEEIANDPVEGNYFSMDGFTLQGRWGYGIDGFDLCMERGELLARIYTNADPNRRGLGAGMNMSGLVGGFGGDFSAEGGGILVKSVADFSDPHGQATVVDNGTHSDPLDTAPFTQPWQQGGWVWQRLRSVDEGGNLAGYDVTTWYGDIEDEPDAVDGSVINVPFNPAVPRPAAIGWFTIPILSTGFEQRIAFLSFSDDPDIKPPPLPSDLGSVWTERVNP